MSSLLLLLALTTMTTALRSQPTSATAFHAEVVGQGPHLIFLPELGCPASSWDSVISRLQSAYTCHRLSVSGFAGTPPVGADHLLEHLKNDLVFYLKERQLHHVLLIGHGYGALAALWMAAQEPDLAAGIVVVDALPFQAAATQPATTPQMVAPVANRRQQQLLMMNDKQFEQYYRQLSAGLFTDTAFRRQYVSWMVGGDRTTIARANFEFMTLDLREQLYEVKAPVLVLIAGAAMSDQAALLSVFREQYRHVSQLQLNVQASAGHFMILEEPEWTAQQVRAFARKILER